MSQSRAGNEVQPQRAWASVRLAADLVVTTWDNRWSAGEAHYLFHEIFTHDDYLVGLPPLPADAVVVDAGANIGLFALRVARSCPGARLLVIEPVPGTCALLRRNLLDDGVEAEVRQVALGARAGRSVLTVYRHLPANSTDRPQQKPPQWLQRMRASEPLLADELLATDDVEVEVVRLSEILPADVPIALLKVDVEGGELDALRGVDAADWPRIQTVVAEVHDVDGRLAAVLDLLRGQGFTCATRVPAMMAPELEHHLVTARRG